MRRYVGHACQACVQHARACCLPTGDDRRLLDARALVAENGFRGLSRVASHHRVEKRAGPKPYSLKRTLAYMYGTDRRAEMVLMALASGIVVSFG